MKKMYLLGLASMLISGCSLFSSGIESAKTYENIRGFEPTDPLEYDDKIQIVTGVPPNDSLTLKEIKLLMPEQVLSFLNNETVLVTIGQITDEGKITYLPVTVSAKSTSYKVIMDYMKFATLASRDKVTGELLGFRRVGVGLRMISLITTKEAGINIGDLSSIGAAAKSGKLNGTLMIEVVGIKSKEVTTLLPLPSEINQSTIQNAMQALATIKSKIYDNDTRLFPQVMAVKYNKTDDTAATPTKINNLKDEILVSDAKLQIQMGSAKEERAAKLENQAFAELFEKDIYKALATFKECYATHPKYHNIEEITDLLEKNKTQLIDKNAPKWKEIYNIIVTIYSWGLSEEIKQKLKTKGS